MIEGLLIKYAGTLGQNGLFIIIMGWCIMKIGSLIKTTNAISKALVKKVEEKDFDEKVLELKESMSKMEVNNKDDHDKLFTSSTEQLRILSFLEGKASKA